MKVGKGATKRVPPKATNPNQVGAFITPKAMGLGRTLQSPTDPLTIILPMISLMPSRQYKKSRKDD